MIRRWMVLIGMLLFGLLLGASGLAQSYGEAPMLQDLVAQGMLPPVKERLPLEPLVVEPVEGIGVYGGTARTATTRATSWGDDLMMMSVFTGLIQPSAALDELVANFARDFNVSDDMTTFTFYLREGLRWSDGHPFTADDILFWYEDVLLNDDLTPSIGAAWRAAGEVLVVEKLDDFTVQYRFAAPRPFFLEQIVHVGDMYLPKHYLQQFHPSYADPDALAAAVSAAGYDDWVGLFSNRNQRSRQATFNPELPTLNSYALESIDSERRIWVRNPYYWKVDTAGNQLPYIDRIEAQIVGSREVLNGMVISGSLDFAGFESDIRDYPLLVNYADEGGYRTLLWTSAMNQTIYMLNMTHPDPMLRQIFSDVRFRQALSLAIDRDEINEVIFHGHGEPRQMSVLAMSRYFKPEYASSFVSFDRAEANRLLDEMGLDQRDNQGYRMMPDGRRLTFTLEYLDSETPKQPNVELVTQHWQEIGVDMRSRVISGELQRQRAEANLMDASVWHGDSSTDIRFPTEASAYVPISRWDRTIWPAWGQWYASGGNAGEEPPAAIQELYNAWIQLLQEPDEAMRTELAQMLLDAQAANLWTIGTVANTPYPIVVNQSLRNVPEHGFWVWDSLWSCSRHPETFYFEQ